MWSERCGVSRDLERGEAEAMHERRYLDCRREAGGSVRLEARLAPEVGEMLLKALEAAHEELEARDGDKEGSPATDVSAEATVQPAALPAPGDVSAETFEPEGAADPVADSANVSAETFESLAARPLHGSVSAETSGTQSARWRHLCRAPEDVSAETSPRSVSQRRADALEHILGRFLAGKCSTSSAGAHEVVVHIAHDALCDVPESSGAEFDNGRNVAVETARRLGCDGALVGVVEGAKGEPLAVGRRTRSVPPAIRRALRMRDGGCRFPGCGRSRYMHAHHIKHWADGGETALDNLATLCSFHHRQVHEGGFGVRMSEGEIEFLRPNGETIPPAGKAQDDCFRGNNCANTAKHRAATGAKRLKSFNAERGLNIDAQTARCKWGGERMDYNIAIDGLCWKAGHR